MGGAAVSSLPTTSLGRGPAELPRRAAGLLRAAGSRTLLRSAAARISGRSRGAARAPPGGPGRRA
eukprot:4871679-Alexandrium_andersonii.AAC.1